MLYAIKSTLRLAPQSLLWGGVPCGLLVFLSLGTKAQCAGNGRHHQTVRRGLKPLPFQVQLALPFGNSKGGLLGMRQPISSCLRQTPYFDFLMEIKAVPAFLVRLPDPRTCQTHSRARFSKCAIPT